MSAPRRPPLEPMRTNDYAPVIFASLGWAIAFIVLLVRHDQMSASGQGWWLWVTVAGFVGGLWGLLLVALNHRSARRRRPNRESSGESSGEQAARRQAIS